MLKGAHNTFVVVVNFLSNNAKLLKHIMMGLFIAMSIKLKHILEKFTFT
jgi:hypothetical protein